MIKSTRRDKRRQKDPAAGLSVLIAGLFVSTAVFAQTNAIQDLHITVESGDTFSGIVTREMKSFDAWGAIARHNKLDSPDDLKPGDVIIIPAEVLRLRNYATVIFAKGAATHQNSVEGTKGKVAKGDKIYAGDVIETSADGFVSLTFNGGSSVNIQPDSTMKIDVLECIDRESACAIKLRSEKGQLGLDVQGSGFAKPTVFSIDSPYANAAVRGTRFDFDVDNGNALGVTEGSVEISFNGVSNEIKEGKGVLTGDSRSITDLYDLLARPEFNLDDEITYVSSEDVISWNATNGAASYLIAFDRNESLQSPLLSSKETNTYIKPELPAGDFFISGRSVDTNGLRGFTSKNVIRSVAIDEQIDSPEIEVQIDGAEMKITAPGSPADDFEVSIGNAVVVVDGIEYIVSQDIRRLKGGESTTVDIDPAKQWYLKSRKIVNQNNVSPYGLLYFFDKTGG